MLDAMTPEQHAARADQLITEAERLYGLCRAASGSGSDATGPAPAADVTLLAVTTQLAQAHATLALSRSVPTAYRAPAGHHDGVIVHYGDDDPTFDRR